jgi:hypothetical protein
VREPGDRRLFAEVLRWDKPVKLSWGGMEWFTRDREPPASRPSPELPGWCGPQPHNGGVPTSSTRRIDLAVAAVMAFSVASTEPGPQLFVFDEADAWAPVAEGEGPAAWASPCRQRSRQRSRR